ncbi:MAG: hypothetical protein L0H93_08540 [Nocardioides sp.]|nr:hypothetical protein [Nocardioides sp.]
MGHSMTVDGSPASCRASARAVRRLGLEMEQAGNCLARVRSLGLSGWSGEAAEQFGARTSRLIDASDTASDGLVTFADALDARADAIAEAKAEMQRARSVAAKADIAIHGDSFPSYGEVDLKPGQEGPRDHGEAIVTRAREAEEAANTVFEAAVAAARSLTWTGEPASPVGALASPTDHLPDLTPLLRDVPGTPLPMPDRHDWSGLSSLIPALVKEAPDLTRAAGRGLGRKALGPLKAGFDQWLDDLPNEDLSIADRLLRAGFVGGATVAGGAGAAYLCTQFVVTAPLAPGCAYVGASAGGEAADKILEYADAH